MISKSKIRKGLLLSFVGLIGLNVIGSTLRYPSMIQARDACLEWSRKGGEYTYEVSGPTIWSSPQTKTAYSRQCSQEAETNQWLGRTNTGEFDYKITKHFRY